MKDHWVLNENEINTLFDDFYEIDKATNLISDNSEDLYKLVIAVSSLPLSKKDNTFLSKVLSAIHVTLVECKFILTETMDLGESTFPKNLLIFDSSHSSTFNMYEPILVEDQRQFHFDSLTRIQESRDLKVKLWNNLKTIKL